MVFKIVQSAWKRETAHHAFACIQSFYHTRNQGHFEGFMHIKKTWTLRKGPRHTNDFKMTTV